MQQLGARLLELIQGSCVGYREQSQRRVVSASLMLAVRRMEPALCPAPRIGRQFDGALAKRRSSTQPASRPRSAGQALQLGGEVLVEPGRRMRKMPGAAIGVDVGIGRLGQRPVNALSLLWRCRALHRRTHERMAEADLRPEVDESGDSRTVGVQIRQMSRIWIPAAAFPAIRAQHPSDQESDQELITGTGRGAPRWGNCGCRSSCGFRPLGGTFPWVSQAKRML